jgi:hypothetical protein
MKGLRKMLKRACLYTTSAAMLAAGMLPMIGCRAEYDPITEREAKHYAVWKNTRAEGYPDAARIQANAPKSLENVLERKAGDYASLGEYAKLAQRIEKNNYLMRSALRGADAAVLDLYNLRNKNDSYSEKLAKEASDRLKESSLDMEKLTQDLLGENGEPRIGYNDLVALASTGEKGKALAAEFKGYAAELWKRNALANAIDRTEAVYDARKIGVGNELIGHFSGIRSSDMDSRVVVKAGLAETIEAETQKSAEWLNRNRVTDPERAARLGRHGQGVPAMRMFGDSKFSGAEAGALIYAVDSRIAAKLAKMPEYNGWKTAAHEGGCMVVPFYELLSEGGALDCASNFAASDTTEGAVRSASKGKKTEAQIVQETMDESMQVWLATTNGRNVPGSKGRVVGTGLLRFLQFGSKVYAVYAISTAGGGGGGGDSGGGGGGLDPTPTPNPQPR